MKFPKMDEDFFDRNHPESSCGSTSNDKGTSVATTTSELPVFVVTMTLYRQEDSRRLTTRAMKTAALNVATTTLLATATSLSADNNERLWQP
jgi:hypothetical protein